MAILQEVHASLLVALLCGLECVRVRASVRVRLCARESFKFCKHGARLGVAKRGEPNTDVLKAV